MKPMKLTSLVMMLLIAFSAAAQEEFFDDVYFSSKNKKKKEQVEEKKVVQPKQESRTLVATAKSQASSDSRDVDEYNRRYTSVEVEEPYREDDSVIYEDSDENESSSERRSDTEYTERIIRYHSPSKITIAGADQVDLYLSDGYYGYGYDTDYSNGSANVNFNINVGNGWGSPWYTGWYDPWFYSYSPWWTYSSRFYGVLGIRLGLGRLLCRLL